MISERDIKCFGCKSCMNICPVSAISFQRDVHGFSYPKIDKNICIKCNKCDIVCGLTSQPQIEKQEPEKLLAVKLKDDYLRHKSSSGGVFMLIAKNVLESNGVVYGCYLNDDLHAVFGRAENLEDCYKFMGSKYVQSDLGDTVKKITIDLNSNRVVLFTGAPCQCLAVKKYTNNNKYKDNLFLCEFFCHGMPSPLYFSNFVLYMENKYQGKVKKLVFRDKEKVSPKPSCRGIRMEIRTSDGILDVYDPKSNNLYYEPFKYNYTLKPSCFDCPCIGWERFSDFTMGDYWGCENYHSEFFDKEGISLLMVNSFKGNKLFDRFVGEADFISVEKNEINQHMLHASALKRKNYEEFWNIYFSKGFVAASEYCIKRNSISAYKKIYIALKTKCSLMVKKGLKKCIVKRK